VRKSQKEYKKKWYKQNKARLKPTKAEYYQKNKGYFDKKNKEWAENNVEEVKEYKKKYRENNREKLRKSGREYSMFNNKSIKGKYAQYKHGAKRRGLLFDLTLSEFTYLMENDCYYCGSSTSTGVDRMDNTLGYLKENSVPCCDICNRMKFKYSVKDFIDHCRKVTEYNE